MYRPRIIPCLLLKNKGLVKSTKYNNYRYIGDPMNAVRIFNAKEADELIFLDILASKENRTIPIELIRKIGGEAYMPFAVGGGITSVKQMREILKAGAEKIILNTAAVKNPNLIKEAAEEFGSSTIVVSMDIRKTIFKKEKVYIYNGKRATRFTPLEFAQLAEHMGAGELMVNAIEHDGMMTGYNIGLVKEISDSLGIPVIANCGAGSYKDLLEVYINGNASAMAVGSLFVYFGDRRAVLINYPEKKIIQEMFKDIQ